MKVRGKPWNVYTQCLEETFGEEVREDHKTHFGVDLTIVQDPQGDIRHIDCWAKLLSDDTILVSSDPMYDVAVAQFENMQYKVIRIDAGKEKDGQQPYTNSLIFNKRVYVPIRSPELTKLNAEAINT